MEAPVIKTQRSVYLSDEVWTELRKAAIDRKVPVSALIEEILRGWLVMVDLASALKEGRETTSGRPLSKPLP